MHLLETGIFSQYHVNVRPTKIMNRAYKHWAPFYKTKYFKNQSFQKISLIKVGLLIKYSSQKKKFGKIRPILDTEKCLCSTNFAVFDKVFHNFGKFEDVII